MILFLSFSKIRYCKTLLSNFDILWLLLLQTDSSWTCLDSCVI